MKPHQPHKETVMSEETLRVVSAPLIEVGEVKVYFAGTREECYAYMRRRGGTRITYLDRA
jgi:hypothetical protein